MNLELIIPAVAIVIVLALVLGRKGKRRKPGRARGKELRVEGNRLSADLTYAKWFGAPDLAPSKVVRDATWYTDAQIVAFLDEMVTAGCNTVLLKTAGFPVLSGQWLKRMQWFVRECDKRGIYCQINVGPDFWGAGPGNQYAEGHAQRYNWWRGDVMACAGYIKQVVRTFAPLSDRIFWEVSNECGKGDGDAFRSRATHHYIPAIRSLDNRPIGASEQDMWSLPVDMLELHDPALIKRIKGQNRPVVLNELAGSASWGWQDKAVRRGPASRWTDVAQAVWNAGGSGVSGATWLDISRPLNATVRAMLRGLPRR